MMWLWLEYFDCVVLIFSVCLIGAAIKLHSSSQKLHRARIAMTMMELNQGGTIMWWRQRALTAERELRALRGD